MAEPAPLRSDDRSDLIAALKPATSPVWWEGYLRHLADAKRYREMARDQTGIEFRDSQVQLDQIADHLAEVAGNQAAGFWAARERLLHLCPRAWTRLPHPSSDLSRIDPEALAAAVREAVAILAESKAPPHADLPDLVTLDQAAASVHTSKRTLERHKTSGTLPQPKVKGGGGKSAQYDWKVMRPWLEQTFGMKLPERFPGNVR
jgi:hypothetical protein